MFLRGWVCKPSKDGVRVDAQWEENLKISGSSLIINSWSLLSSTSLPSLVLWYYFFFGFFRFGGFFEGRTQKSLQSELREPYRMLQIKPMSATCRASALPSVLSLWFLNGIFSLLWPLDTTSLGLKLRSNILIFMFLLNLGYAQLCSGLTPKSALMNHSYRCLGNLMGCWR